MIPTYFPILSAVLLFIGMLIFIEAGLRMAKWRMKDNQDGGNEGISSLTGAIFALFGLLVAFTFSGAATRFDARRQLVVEEVNDIGTAYLRLDLLPEPAQSELKAIFRRYVDSRIETYKSVPDFEKVQKCLMQTTQLQNEIWAKSIIACREKGDPSTTSLLLSSLNALIDITTTRLAATQIHPPSIIFIMLFGLALGCAYLGGYGMATVKNRPWTHMVAFAGIAAFTVFVIIDIEYPRLGLIRVEESDQLLVDLRASMK